ncbi:MAG: DUF1801 domain-containing protein [Chloroflexia bacterium]
MSMTPEEFLAKHTQEVKALVQRAREIVRAANPDAVETVNPGHGNLAYSSGPTMEELAAKDDALFHAKLWYCYIAPFKSYMNLGFLRGNELPDPDGLLEGTGKQLRHIKIRSIEDVERPGVIRLLVAAQAMENQ